MPVDIYLLRVNNKKLEKVVKYVHRMTSWRHSGVFIINLEHILHLVLVFLLLTLKI